MPCVRAKGKWGRALGPWGEQGARRRAVPHSTMINVGLPLRCPRRALRPFVRLVGRAAGC